MLLSVSMSARALMFVSVIPLFPITTTVLPVVVRGPACQSHASSQIANSDIFDVSNTSKMSNAK